MNNKIIGKIVIATILFLLVYIFVIPLLFCGNVDFDFTKNQEYLSCSQDSDCIAKSCGCLNEKGAKKFSFWMTLCGMSLKCVLPSSCSCQDEKCVSSYDYGNDIVEEVSLTTDKTEYQTGEEVKLTVENNLDEGIEFYAVSVEKFNNSKWEQVRLDVGCLGLYEEMQMIIGSKNNKSFLWDQKNSIGLQAEIGRFRFRIGVWDNAWIGDRLPPMFNYYYSNEFIIKSDLAGVGGLDYCQKNSDCVPCGDNCISIEKSKYVSCKYFQDVKCVCENNKCIDKNSLSSRELSTEDIIRALIQQMGGDNISQETKNAIPEKLYDYGKEAIPYLIEALDDERVFDACYVQGSMLKLPDVECNQRLVKYECGNILRTIINPQPILYIYLEYMNYNADWQQWWNENQDKSLNEIRKMVRDLYRAEEEKNNYSATGYRGEEYDYLDFIGNLTDWDWDSGQDCHGLTNSQQCDYLDWSINYGCRAAQIVTCYECLAEKNKDATICENIEDENWVRKDNCYWRLVISLSKAGMNDEIDFCDKFSGEWKESYKEECLKLAK